MDIVAKFLQAEINSKEAYEDICSFIESYGIRNGEFEGNEYIIKKMDRDNFIVFPEYTDNTGEREIPFSLSIYKGQLIKEINKYALDKEIIR